MAIRPFNKKGRDMDFDDCKYIMVGADQGSKNYLSAMALDPTFMFRTMMFHLTEKILAC